MGCGFSLPQPLFFAPSYHFKMHKLRWTFCNSLKNEYFCKLDTPYIISNKNYLYEKDDDNNSHVLVLNGFSVCAECY